LKFFILIVFNYQSEWEENMEKVCILCFFFFLL
jgi:hypothetical protein